MTKLFASLISLTARSQIFEAHSSNNIRRILLKQQNAEQLA